MCAVFVLLTVIYCGNAVALLASSCLEDSLPHSSCRLVGDVLLASGFLSYLGPFNQEFRLLLLDLWKQELKKRAIPYTTNINLIEMLVEPTTVSPLAMSPYITYRSVQ